jgi:hypothetical protein
MSIDQRDCLTLEYLISQFLYDPGKPAGIQSPGKTLLRYARELKRSREEHEMALTKMISTLTLLAAFSLPAAMPAQDTPAEERHRRAQRSQDIHDKEHHNTAKVVGGSAAGGAVLGGVLGGGKGALIGGAAGAGGGVIADKVRKHKGVEKRENQDPR